MFWFDKDMERVMLAKKKEVLQEIETAKKRVLEELYCLKRSAHSDLCSLQADYNRMALTLTNTVNEIRAELKCITDEYKSMIATTFNQYTTTIENKLLALETFENEVIKEVNDKLSELDTMKAQVEALIAEMEQIVADGVTEADLTTLKEELLIAMESAGAQADWNESDETSAAFVKNRTHYGEFSVNTVVDRANLATDFEKLNASVKGGCTFRTNISAEDFTNYAYIDVTVEGDPIPAEKTYRISVSQGDFVIERFVRNGSTVTKEFDLRKDVLFAGDASSIYSGRFVGTDYNTIETPIRLFVDPADNMLYFVIYINGSFDVAKMYVTLKTYARSAVKHLDPAYMAEPARIGSVLTLVGNQAQWVAPLVERYTKIGAKMTHSFHLDYDVSTSTSTTLKFSKKANTLKDLVVDTEYIVVINGVTIPCTPARTYLMTFDSNNVSLSNEYSYITFTTPVTSTQYFPDDYETAGVDISIYIYDRYEYKGKLSPEYVGVDPANGQVPSYQNGEFVWIDPIVIVSNNGTKYKLTVSDDGTLSTTPVT